MATDWHSEETYKGLIQLGVAGLRFGALVNGGSAVALLALVGDLYGNGVSVPSVKGSMILFILGLVCAGFAHMFAYVMQLRLYVESALDAPKNGLFRHGNFLYTALSLAVISIILFASGAVNASSALSAPQTSDTAQLVECPKAQTPARTVATELAEMPVLGESVEQAVTTSRDASSKPTGPETAEERSP